MEPSLPPNQYTGSHFGTPERSSFWRIHPDVKLIRGHKGNETPPHQVIETQDSEMKKRRPLEPGSSLFIVTSEKRHKSPRYLMLR